jgi:hypothetical protein
VFSNGRNVYLAIAGGTLFLSASAIPVRTPFDALAKGLKIWRKPGAIQNGAACATCHSPDGIEIAAYNFDDADISRRALAHLNTADTQELVSYIHALRSKFHFKKLRDPNSDRPLQPGGSYLNGNDPAARDFAFGQELQGLLPRLFHGRIETVAQAKAAESNLLAIDPVNLRVGIPLNRLSEDIAHGNEHSSIAQWLPEIAPIIPSDKLASWYAAEDRYLLSPLPSELHKLLLFHSQLVNSNRMMGMGVISTAKFRALLVLQDRMRNHSEAFGKTPSADVVEYGNYNPIWEVGEAARDMMDRSPRGLGMDPETRTRKLEGPTLSDQLHALRLSWFWAGWLSDQGLFKTSHDDDVRLGRWLSESLSKDGPYPIHNVFANARRQVVVSNVLDSWGEPIFRRRRIWDFAGLRIFQTHVKDIPIEPTYRKMYVAFTANCFRMNLLLLADDIHRTKTVWVKRNTKASVSELVAFIKTQDPADSANASRLERELDSVIDRATERFTRG